MLFINLHFHFVTNGHFHHHFRNQHAFQNRRYLKIFHIYFRFTHVLLNVHQKSHLFFQRKVYNTYKRTIIFLFSSVKSQFIVSTRTSSIVSKKLLEMFPTISSFHSFSYLFYFMCLEEVFLIKFSLYLTEKLVSILFFFA